MRCSIIVPTYNRAASLRRALDALVRLDYDDYETIVVDDASTDETSRMVREEFPQVRYVRFEQNQREWVARNRGIAEATGDLLVFTDDDCVVGRAWLRRHVAHYADPGIGAVGGPVEPRAPTLYDKFHAAHARDVYREEERVERLQGFEDLITANLSVPRRAIERVGTFDTRFVTGGDTDLVRRVSRAGYAFVRDPALAVEHLKSYSFSVLLRDRFRKSSGSVLTDAKEGTLGPRRFIPLPNPLTLVRDWRHFRDLYGGSAPTAAAFCLLAAIVRCTEVAGRVYYYWTHARHQDWERAGGEAGQG